MSPTTARQELHQLIDRLDEPRLKRVLRLVKTEATEAIEERPWPGSIGSGHSGLGDVASNPEKYLTNDFGR